MSRRKITLPWDLREDVGAGDVLASVLKKFGAKPCNACEERRRRMNDAVTFTGKKPCNSCGKER